MNWNNAENNKNIASKLSQLYIFQSNQFIIHTLVNVLLTKPDGGVM